MIQNCDSTIPDPFVLYVMFVVSCGPFSLSGLFGVQCMVEQGGNDFLTIHIEIAEWLNTV